MLCEARVKFFRQLLVIPAAISIAVPVAADMDSGNTKYDSDSLQITVTGTRSEKFVDDVPSSIDVIDLSDYKYDGLSELKDLFKYETGVSVEFNNAPSYGTISSTGGNVNIRGMELNRILFTQDGIRLPAAFGYESGLAYDYDRGDYVDFNTLKAVEVVKGPGSTLYGSDALGGIISFRSLQASDILKPGEDFTVEIPASFTGFNNGKSGSVKIATRDEENGLSAVGVISYLRSDESKPKDFKDSEDWINKIDRTGNTYYLNLEKETGENKSVSLNVERVQRDTEAIRPKNTLKTYAPFLPNYYFTVQEQDIETTKDRIMVSYNYENKEKNSGINSFIAKGYYQNAEIDDVWDEKLIRYGVPTHAISDYQFKDKSYGADVQFGSQINDHKLTYGFTFSDTDNSYLQNKFYTNTTTNVTTTDHKKRVPDGETERLGIFLQDEIQLGKVDVIAGIRFENTKVNVESDAVHTAYCTANGGCNNGELDVNAFTPKIGAIMDINPNISVYGQYAMGFKVPTWSEMNSEQTNFRSRYQVIPNPDLEPEKSHSYEIGLRSTNDRNKFRIATFYNKYTDFIGSKSLGTQTVAGVPNMAVSTPVNNEEAKIYGVEVNNDFIVSDNEKGKISLINSLAYLKGDDETNDEPLNRIDPFKLVTGIRYDDVNEKFNTQLIATYTGKARLPESDSYYNPSAVTVFDLLSNYNINDDFSVDLGIYNLADKRYYLYQNTRTVRASNAAFERYSQPGRSLKGGFKYRF